MKRKYILSIEMNVTDEDSVRVIKELQKGAKALLFSMKKDGLSPVWRLESHPLERKRVLKCDLYNQHFRGATGTNDE